MTIPEQIDTFDAATIAFEIRFERELASRWQDLERKAQSQMIGSSLGERHSALYRFCEDVKEEIRRAVHEYFPKLLGVAITYRDRLGKESPLTWTQAKVLTQVCVFLRMEEKFDPSSIPTDQSLVLKSAARIIAGIGWLGEELPADFLLPRWVDGSFALTLLIRYEPEDFQDDSEASAPLSRTETLKWVKQQEFWISKSLDAQIDDESWDALIDAGKNGVSILEVDVRQEPPNAAKKREAENDPSLNSFVREATTWSITFEGEICRVPDILGLSYVSILLQNPGRPMTGLAVQHAAGGLPSENRSWGRSRSDSLAKRSSFDSADAEDNISSNRSDFSRSVMLDEKGRQKVETRMSEIEREVAYRTEIGDVQAVDTLQKEYAEIERYLGGARNIHRQPRAFADENEKARMSITSALKRAYRSIGAQAPKTAHYLEKNITTGSEFMFRDGSTNWNIRRTS